MPYGLGFLNKTACEPCGPSRYSEGGAPCANCTLPRIVVKATGKCSLPGAGQIYNADHTGFVSCKPGEEPDGSQSRMHGNWSLCRRCEKMMLSRTGQSCSYRCPWDRDPKLVITRLEVGSTELTCKPCEEGQQPNDEHSACVAACPERCAECSSDGRVCHKCDASGGYYNSSEQLVLCFPDEFYDNATVSDKRKEYQQDKETDGHCQSVPSCATINADVRWRSGEVIRLSEAPMILEKCGLSFHA